MSARPSSTQLSEIHRLTLKLLGTDHWPAQLHPLHTRADADKVLRALLTADNISGSNGDPDLVNRIASYNGAASDPAQMLALIEKRKEPTMRDIRPDETWIDWASDVLGMVYEQETHSCPECGGTGTINVVARATVPEVLGAITGRTAGNLGPNLVRKSLQNPDLATLRRVSKLLNFDLEESAHFVAELVEAFDTHPAKPSRRAKR